ncbi:MAG: DUF5723 family protein [Bacteroidota bacterium]|nr:DUF5723 family protein [Bacteroidota bacterium]
MKKTFFLIILISFSVTLKAQDFLGYANSNYSGVSGADLQPAAIVNSRYRVDISLIGFSASLYNNYLGLNKNVLKDFDNADFDLFTDGHSSIRNNKRNKSFYFSGQVYLPSFLISINSKNAFALKGKVRNLFNLDGVSPELASYLFNAVGNSSLAGQGFYNKKMNIANMSWIDYGITFGHVFKSEGKHFLKGGATVKLLQGLQASYMHLDNMVYEADIDSDISISDAYVGFGYSNTDDITFNPSVGFDFGAVYEWRPDFEKYRYDMDGKTCLWRADNNKYKLRVGFSVLDIGSVKFKSAQGGSGNINSGNANSNNIQEDNPFDLPSYSQTIKMKLPTVISAQVDYNIHNNFYVNFTPYLALKFKNNNTKVHDISMFSITPRWDHKWFGMYTPISYDLMGNTKLGLALRIGPLVFGTNSLGPWILNKPIYGADFHVLLKIPILYGCPRDRDHDQVSNRKDKCRDIAGTWEFRGCPDRDGDHILDIDDDCPDNQGLPKFKGCPDSDNDNIIDKDDLCPDKPGPVSNHGCPELKLSLVDSSGAILQTVIAEKNGNFIFKNLPEVDLAIFKLTGENTDTTSIVNVMINGSTKPAIRDNNDHLFRFKRIYKESILPVAPDSIVSVNKSGAETLNKTINNFDLSKATINSASYIILDELVNEMNKNPDWTLKISGHTDNTGSEIFNMNLSKKRAEAVKKYFIKKGISPDKLKIESFGSTQSIADNTTKEGRKKNRRVEMLIINE